MGRGRRWPTTLRPVSRAMLATRATALPASASLAACAAPRRPDHALHWLLQAPDFHPRCAQPLAPSAPTAHRGVPGWLAKLDGEGSSSAFVPPGKKQPTRRRQLEGAPPRLRWSAALHPCLPALFWIGLLS